MGHLNLSSLLTSTKEFFFFFYKLGKEKLAQGIKMKREGRASPKGAPKMCIS